MSEGNNKHWIFLLPGVDSFLTLRVQLPEWGPKGDQTFTATLHNLFTPNTLEQVYSLIVAQLGNDPESKKAFFIWVDFAGNRVCQMKYEGVRIQRCDLGSQDYNDQSSEIPCVTLHMTYQESEFSLLKNGEKYKP